MSRTAFPSLVNPRALGRSQGPPDIAAEVGTGAWRGGAACWTAHIESEPGCLGGVGLQRSTLNEYVFAEVVGRHRLSNTSDNRDSWALLVQVSLGGCQ